MWKSFNKNFQTIAHHYAIFSRNFIMIEHSWVNYLLSNSFWHNLYSELAQDWQIDVGVHSRSAQESNQKAYQVREILVHENYNPSYLLSDIAILRLTSPVTENTDVAPICVTSIPIEDFYGQNCVVIGWGVTSESKVLSLFIIVLHE